MSVPKDLIGLVNHKLESSPLRDVLLEFAKEVQLLKGKVYCTTAPPKAVISVMESVSPEVVAVKSKKAPPPAQPEMRRGD